MIEEDHKGLFITALHLFFQMTVLSSRNCHHHDLLPASAVAACSIPDSNTTPHIQDQLLLQFMIFRDNQSSRFCIILVNAIQHEGQDTAVYNGI